MKNISILSIDLAKNVFQLHGINQQGKTVFKKRLYRSRLKELIANLPPCLIQGKRMKTPVTAGHTGRFEISNVHLRHHVI